VTKLTKRKSKKRSSNNLVKIALDINRINLKKKAKHATVLQTPFILHAIILYYANERLKTGKKEEREREEKKERLSIIIKQP